MLLRTMSHFDPHRKNALSHARMWWGFRSFEIGQNCYANPQLLMTNRQSALGQFSIGRVGQFSISADTQEPLRVDIVLLSSHGNSFIRLGLTA